MAILFPILETCISKGLLYICTWMPSTQLKLKTLQGISLHLDSKSQGSENISQNPKWPVSSLTCYIAFPSPRSLTSMHTSVLNASKVTRHVFAIVSLLYLLIKPKLWETQRSREKNSTHYKKIKNQILKWPRSWSYHVETLNQLCLSCFRTFWKSWITCNNSWRNLAEKKDIF